jgi:hypothetical protein
MIDTVQDACGMRPNRAVFGLDSWKAFRRHSDVRNIIYGTNNGGGYPNTRQVGDVLEIENVMVGGTYQNTGAEGQAESLAKIWTDNVLIYYAPPNPTIERPSFMYSFRWEANGLPNMQVERHPFDSRTKTEDVEVGYYQDEKVTASEYAGLITGAIS